METPYRPPSILRLRGITRKDWVPVEDMADERLLSAGADGAAGPEDPAPESILPPDKIPRVFTGLEDWPHSTNLRCWQCDFAFDDRPKFVPTHVREAESGGIEFGVHGNMCTFNCVELWISINYAGKEDQRWRAQDNLCIVYFLFTGRRVARIRPAPHKTELRQYGGELDEDAFWKKMRDLDTVAGLRDHTPGSVVPERDRAPVVPERDRVKTALAALRVSGGLGGAPVLRALAAGDDTLGSRRPVAGEPLLVGKKSAWGVCGLPCEDAREGPVDSVSVAVPAGAPAPRVDNITVDDLEALIAGLDGEPPAVAAADEPDVAEDAPAEDAADEPEEDADEPDEDAPAEDEPAEDEPAEDEPAEDEPAEDEPAEDEPAEDEPAEDEPDDAEDAPADEPDDAEDAPADEPAAEDAPADEPAAEDAPTDEPAAAEDAPAEEPVVVDKPPISNDDMDALLAELGVF